jgi:hypothetical protein
MRKVKTRKADNDLNSNGGLTDKEGNRKEKVASRMNCDAT